MSGRNGRGQASPSGSGLDLVQKWATAIGGTAQVPMSTAETHHYLRDLLHRLEIALSGPVVDTRAVSEVGAELVAGDFTEPQSLSRTVEVLAKQLPTTLVPTAVPDTIAGGSVPQLLGALVAGYLEAWRTRLFHQQQWVKRALLADQHDLQRDVQLSQARFSALFDSSEVGIAISRPDGSIVRTNPSLDEILGYVRGELRGRELSQVFVPEDRPVLQQHYRQILAGEQPRVATQTRLLRKDGETAWAHLTCLVLGDNTETPQFVVTMIRDITELHLLRKQFSYHTLHDLRTGLPNRQYFVAHLHKVLGLLKPSAVITLLRLDLDGFSVIHDGLGRRFGDQALNILARRLESIVADQPAMVARLSDDECAILIQPGQSVPDVGRLAETINSVLAEPFYLNGLKVTLTATIGIVQRQVAVAEPDELLRDAGITLRRSQRMGGRRWAMFDPGIDGVDLAETRLAATLPEALEDDLLRVCYQPVVSLGDGRIVGVEAKLRWDHPELGALSHERCMQLAERTSVVRSIGHWLLHTAVNQARSWQDQLGGELPRMIVDLTHDQAQDPDLVARTRTLLTESDLRPAALELRLPVPAMRPVDGVQTREASANAKDNMQVLADLGMRIALHDFHGGLEELACLTELPVHAVRLAQSTGRIVAGNPSGIQAQALRAIMRTVHAAGIGIVACRVDTEELAEWWRSADAECAVGTFFGPPSAPQDIAWSFAAHPDSRRAR